MGKKNKMPKDLSSVKGFAVGLNKGFVVTRNSKRRVRPVNRKGRVGERVALVSQTIKTVCGFAPYEKRAIEMFKVGNAKLDKRVSKFLKRRLGSLKRGHRKVAELGELLKKKK